MAKKILLAGESWISYTIHVKGKSGVFTSDCAPHWGPPAFVEWEFYDALWQGIVGYLTSV